MKSSHRSANMFAWRAGVAWVGTGDDEVGKGWIDEGSCKDVEDGVGGWAVRVGLVDWSVGKEAIRILPRRWDVFSRCRRGLPKMFSHQRRCI